MGDQGLQLRATAGTGSIPQLWSGVEVKFYSTSYKLTLKQIVDGGLEHVALWFSKNAVAVSCKRPQPLCQASTTGLRTHQVFSGLVLACLEIWFSK